MTPRSFRAAGLVLCALLLSAQLATGLERYFVNDDFQVLYTAWLQSIGMVPGKDFFVASFSPLIDLLEPWFHWFPDSFAPAYIGRFIILACLAACAWIASRIADELFGGSARFIAPIIFLASAPVVHRGIDIRPDLISTLLSLWAVLLLVKHPRPAARVAFLVGMLVGMAVVNRFKAIVIAPGLALALTWSYWQMSARVSEKALALARTAAAATAGAALPILACAAYLFHRGTLETFALADLRLLTGGESFSGVTGGLRSQMLASWFSADRLLPWMLTASVACAAVERVTAPRWGPPTLILVLTSAILVYANSAFYAYNLVSLSAMLAPVAAWPLARLLEAGARVTKPQVHGLVGIGLLAMFPLLQARNLLLYATTNSATHQKALTRFLVTNTAPGDRVFAMEGIGLFRPSNYHWRMPDILKPWYQGGQWSLRAEWIPQPPELIVTSYRVPDWLTPDDRRFLDEHYVHLTPRLLVPGFDAKASAPERPIEVLSQGRFEVISTGDCQVDAQVVASGQVLDLAAGPHRLSVTSGDCTLRRPYSAAAIESLDNPKGLPYLYPPTLAMPKH